MNLTQNVFLLSEPAEECLHALYRKSKISGSVPLNFLAAALQIPPAQAVKTAEQLHALGLVRYEPYGRFRLTAEGAAYCQTMLKNANHVKKA